MQFSRKDSLNDEKAINTNFIVFKIVATRIVKLVLKVQDNEYHQTAGSLIEFS